MKKYQNVLLLAGVVLLLVVPLALVEKPAPDQDQKEVEIFAGADGQAKDLVTQIKPDYQPWMAPLFEPPSGEIEAMLFSLQAALGAGFIGYYLGSAVTRGKLKQNS